MEYGAGLGTAGREEAPGSLIRTQTRILPHKEECWSSWLGWGSERESRDEQTDVEDAVWVWDRPQQTRGQNREQWGRESQTQWPQIARGGALI